MPNISIKEINRTSAGTPSEYGNIAVLITGLKGTPSDKTDAKIIDPDSNGVYEFDSAQGFKDTIGLVEGEHFGNKMAYELLNLGYPVVYKPFTTVSELNNEAFWEIFKDKANYDFRFISHGLLAADTDADKTLAEYKARLLVIEEELKDENLENFDTLKGTLREDKTVWYTNPLAGDGDYYESAEDAANSLNIELATVNANITKVNTEELTTEAFNSINGQIAKLASYIVDTSNGRGDCIALIELSEKEYIAKTKPELAIIEGIKNMSANIGADGKYCAMTVPSVYYKKSGGTYKMPGAFHYLACFMSSLKAGFAEWYAAAGYTRGVSSYVIDHTSVRLGEIAIAALEPRYSATLPFACNVIANFRGSYYLWGNRTAAPLGKTEKDDLTADHFLNIRQLCSTIKKQLYVSCRRFTFDPNSDTLWYNFTGSIVPTLERMKADQGIRDYKIIKVYTDKKATLKAKIRIIPIEAVEDFDIEISLEDSFGETSVVANG